MMHLCRLAAIAALGLPLALTAPAEAAPSRHRHTAQTRIATYTLPASHRVRRPMLRTSREPQTHIAEHRRTPMRRG